MLGLPQLETEQTIDRRHKVVSNSSKRKLLWVSDGVVHTGFARVAHAILPHLQHDFDVAMLAAHYAGKPHRYPYEIWPGVSQFEPYGYTNLAEVCRFFKPDLLLVLNDAYYVAKFQMLREKEKADWKLVGYMPIDGLHMHPDIAATLSRLDVAVFYTVYGLRVAHQAGFKGMASVIPHGIDRRVFRPMPQLEARQEAGLGGMVGWRDAFIVGNVNRNQPRKRLDLTLAYFADWCEREAIPENVKLYLHCAAKDTHIADVAELAEFFGIRGRLILPGRAIQWHTGVADEQLAAVYNALDLNVSTSLGEGWGLTTMEAMACGVPNLVPEWAALGEWARGAVEYVPCTELEVFPDLENRIGAVPDRQAFVDVLHRLYRDEKRRRELREAGLGLVSRPEFEWPAVASAFVNVLNSVLSGSLPERERIAARI